MATILITGASGFLGSALAQQLATRHQVITIGRRALPDATNQTHYQGEFFSFEDLRQLDPHKIDAVVHLAAVTGGCLERDGIMVNVEGTRCLMRYLMDRGCRKFVNASSIAAVGLQSTHFRPRQVPIHDEHPCLDRDGYGLSKYLMEEVTRYLQRQMPALDVINLRLAAIYPDDAPPAKTQPGPATEWASAQITLLPRSEAVRALTLAVESQQKPGVRILNTVNQQSWVAAPVADVLRTWWGDDVDLTYYENNSATRTASLYTSKAIEDELGFVSNGEG